MRAPKTMTLLLLSVCLFIGGGLAMTGVTVMRPVRTQTGEVVLRDGQPLLERDPLGDFKLNWFAYTCIVGSYVLFGWVLARGCRHWYVRNRTHDTHAA